MSIGTQPTTKNGSAFRVRCTRQGIDEYPPDSASPEQTQCTRLRVLASGGPRGRKLLQLTPAAGEQDTDSPAGEHEAQGGQVESRMRSVESEPFGQRQWGGFFAGSQDGVPGAANGASGDDRETRRRDARRERASARTVRRRRAGVLDREAGMATAEYAIATLAAVGFAALLVAVLSSGEIKGLLMSLITSALNFG